MLFAVEWFTYVLILGVLSWLGKSASVVLNNIAVTLRAKTTESATSLVLRELAWYAIAGFVAMLVIWVLSRIMVWLILTKTRASSKGIIRLFLLGLPYTCFNWLLLAGVLYIGYKVLALIVFIQPPWLGYILAYLVFLVFLGPLMFNITCLNNLAYYNYFQGNPNWLLFYTAPFRLRPFFSKQKNSNTKTEFLNKLKQWEFATLVVSTIFVALNLLFQAFNHLPTTLGLMLMLLFYVLFVVWSKVYMVSVLKGWQKGVH
ncbi:hypothetical protein DRJ48_00030 [Candidatus Woesearchaeota archaeon]|nr:hypothetical protein [Candidatus Woesearchaeota archaeon]RLE43717.1 MAG: hypothetical protein DRJ48_00030 [Candidatus Woesearchaeota archaeon]